MSVGTALQAINTTDDWPNERLELLKRTIAKGATNDELALFLQVCKRTKLDPFSKQIYFVKRWDSSLKREVMQPQPSIDGARIVAERTGCYGGQQGPFWCGVDGVWKEIWPDNEFPVAAKVIVLKVMNGITIPTPAVAHWGEYVQTKKDGSITSMWQRMPAGQLAKCAESLALRKAFPNDLSGLYTVEELPPENPYEAKRIERPIADTQQPVHQLVERSISHKEGTAIHHSLNQTPIETGFGPVPPIVNQLKDLGAVSAQDEYELKNGRYAGLRIKDKPDEFWLEYAQELTNKIKDETIPQKHREGMKEIVLALEAFFAEKP